MGFHPASYESKTERAGGSSRPLAGLFTTGNGEGPAHRLRAKSGGTTVNWFRMLPKFRAARGREDARLPAAIRLLRFDAAGLSRLNRVIFRFSRISVKTLHMAPGHDARSPSGFVAFAIAIPTNAGRAATSPARSPSRTNPGYAGESEYRLRGLHARKAEMLILLAMPPRFASRLP